MQNRRGSRKPPKVVAILGLNEDAGLVEFTGDLLNAAEIAECGTILTALTSGSAWPVTIQVNHGQSLSLLIVPPNVPLAALEIIKVADLLLLVVSVSDHVENLLPENGELSASAARPPCLLHKDIELLPSLSTTTPVLQAQGLPPIICALRGLNALTVKKKFIARKITRDSVRNAFNVTADHVKLYPADTTNELCEFVRQVCEHRCSQPQWRSARAYVLAERFNIFPESAPSTNSYIKDDHTVSIQVEGYVRGSALSANQLVHLPGIGDFPIAQIMAVSAPITNQFSGFAKQDDNASYDHFRDAITHIPDPNHQVIALRENIPDLHSNEQTWPTDEDLALSVGQRISVSDTVYDREGHLCESQGNAVVNNDRGGKSSETRDKNVKITPLGSATLSDHGTIQIKTSCCASEWAAEKDELIFPDEMETPLLTPARERFARYRGLKSFRSSRWDPKEQLPVEYSRLFTFENFRRATRQTLTREQKIIAAGIGDFVRVVVEGVPRVAAMALFMGKNIDQNLAAQCKIHSPGGFIGIGGVGPIWNGWCGGAGPVVLSSLLQHESKLTVMHYSVVKAPSYGLPLRSKTPVWFHVGFRRERASPIFSADGLGDKHKFERFLPQGQRTIATVYGPVTYPPAPVLGFKEEVSAAGINAHLVFSGGVQKSDPDRIILKRIILTGVPFKTHKCKAVVRQMFFNPGDVRWFQPLELWTKCGLRGKIKEAVGTHGHMKCVFNGVIQQRDTVCITLYKRVYPKFLVD